MRRIVSFICATAMMLGGGYFAVTLAAHLMHWVVIVSAGLSVIGMLWLWEDFVSPLLRRERAKRAERESARGDGTGMRRQAA